METIVKTYLPYIMFFGTIAGLLLLSLIIYILIEQGRVQREIMRSFMDFLVAVESLVVKVSPLIEDHLSSIEKTKECPQCKKHIDEAYGDCPFCSHQFVKKYFISIIGPGDEKQLDMAAESSRPPSKWTFTR